MKGPTASFALSKEALITLEDEGRVVVKRARIDLSVVVRRTLSSGEPHWDGPTVLSPDGRWVAVSTPEETVLLQTADFEPVAKLGPSAAVVAFASTGRHLATTSHPGAYLKARVPDPFLRIWSIPDGRLERQVDVGPIRSFAAFAPGDERLIVGPNVPIVTASVATGEVGPLKHHKLFGLSSSGIAVVRAQEHGPLQFVRLADGEILHQRRIDVLNPLQVAFSPEGRFAILSTPAAFEVLDIASGFRELGHPSGFGMDDHVSFASDGRSFAVFEDDELGLYCLE